MLAALATALILAPSAHAAPALCTPDVIETTLTAVSYTHLTLPTTERV